MYSLPVIVSLLFFREEFKVTDGTDLYSTETKLENQTATTFDHRNFKINYRYYPEILEPQTAVIIIRTPLSTFLNVSESTANYKVQGNMSTLEYAEYQFIYDDEEVNSITNTVNTVDIENNTANILFESRLIDDRQETDGNFSLELNNSLEMTNISYPMTNTSFYADELFNSSFGSSIKDSIKSPPRESTSFLQIVFVTFIMFMIIYALGLAICGYVAKQYRLYQSGRIEEHIEMVDLYF
jgi:hypothetical protein